MSIHAKSIMNPFIKKNIKKQLNRELAEAVKNGDSRQVQNLQDAIDSLENCSWWNNLFIVR